MCRYLTWFDKLQLYFEKKQIKILIEFSPIFVADAKINFDTSIILSEGSKMLTQK